MTVATTRNPDVAPDYARLKRLWLTLAAALAVLGGLALVLGLVGGAGFFVSCALAAAMFGVALLFARRRVGKGHEVRIFVVASAAHYVLILSLLPLVPLLAATIVPTAVIPVFLAAPHLRQKGLTRYVAAVIAFCLVYAVVALVLAHMEHLALVDAILAAPALGTAAVGQAQLSEHASRMDVAFASQLLGVIVVVAIILTLLIRYSMANGQVQHLALHDSLTGLANRALFMDRAGHALERARRRGVNVAVLFLDVDGFKSINDQHGHGFGDEILRRLGRLIDASTRATDTAARLGGDEFAVLIEDVEDRSAVHTVANRLRSLLGQPLEMPDGDIQVRVSMGAAFGDEARTSADALVRGADAAMYESKRQRRGELVIYEPAMSAASAERRSVKRAFRGVVERGELRLQFQPFVRLDDDATGTSKPSAGRGAVLGVEALLRWQHPEHGWRMPAQFVSLAEETGDIVPIGRWVLQEAAKQVVDWRRSAGLEHLRLAVNLSVRQLQLRAFEDDVMAVLEETGLPPGATILEVNEVALAAEVLTVPEVLTHLRARGILLALDDFGTSHSSFGTLKDTAVDYVKLDRVLLHDAIDQPTSEAVLRTSVELGRAVGAAVVAEGIETTAQLELLTRLGCEIGQGYLFTPPLNPADMERLLHAETRPWEDQVRTALFAPGSLRAPSAAPDTSGTTGDQAFVS